MVNKKGRNLPVRKAELKKGILPLDVHDVALWLVCVVVAGLGLVQEVGSLRLDVLVGRAVALVRRLLHLVDVPFALVARAVDRRGLDGSLVEVVFAAGRISLTAGISLVAGLKGSKVLPESMGPL